MEKELSSKDRFVRSFSFENREYSTMKGGTKMAFWKALIVNLAVAAIWFWSEYQQYGELQWDRECDNIVFWVYFFILWYLFSR